MSSLLPAPYYLSFYLDFLISHSFSLPIYAFFIHHTFPLALTTSFLAAYLSSLQLTTCLFISDFFIPHSLPTLIYVIPSHSSQLFTHTNLTLPHTLSLLPALASHPNLTVCPSPLIFTSSSHLTP